MNKLTILTISSKDFRESTVTGGHRRYTELIRSLNQGDNKVHLIGPSKIPEIDLHGYLLTTPTKQFSSNLIPNSFFHCLYVVRKAFKNRRKLRETKIDAILVVSITNCLPAIFLKRLLKSRVITFIFSDPEEYREINTRHNGIRIFTNFAVRSRLLNKLYLKAFSMFEKWVLRHSDLIIVQSNRYKELLSSKLGIKERRFRVLYNNINPSWMPSSLKNSNKSSEIEKICFVGSLSRRKGVFKLTRAFIYLSREFPYLSLDIVGHGPEFDKLTKLVSEANLEERIKLHGWVTEPLNIIAESDLLVVPSLSDSFPEVIGESLYVGTPVLGSRVGGIPEQLKYNELLFEAGSEEAIVAKLRPLISNSAKYYHVRNLCDRRAKKLTFNWGHRFQQLIDNYLSCESEKPI